MKEINEKELNELIAEWENKECSFLEMECAFAKKTGDEVLDNNSVEDLLESGSTSFRIKDQDNIPAWINVLYDIIYLDKDTSENTIIKITDIDMI